MSICLDFDSVNVWLVDLRSSSLGLLVINLLMQNTKQSEASNAAVFSETLTLSFKNYDISEIQASKIELSCWWT